MASRERAGGLTRIEVVCISFALVSLAFVAYLPLSKLHESYMLSIYSRCRNNLAAIGKALSSYANDYSFALPISGAPSTKWGPRLQDWTAENRGEAFGVNPDGTGGQASISSSLYLLVRYGGVRPESFICPMEKQAEAFDPNQYGVAVKHLTDLWDFGPNPAKHCSYAYHMVYAPSRIQSPRRLRLAIAADRNPWIDSPWDNAKDFSKFRLGPDLFDRAGAYGNSRAHRGDQQNILFLDGHARSMWRSYDTMHGYQGRAWDEHHELGVVEGDNIYTSWDGKDMQRGKPPIPYESEPAHEFDSLLVNDPVVLRR